ncbi:hypothetical protein [Tropicibacter oceani]|uniref:HBM domain-containing protein n=1 Tax=Tropicibacter oceani TaxID=3058420 RepID=A0ABY8QG41_9RHOB|nr:hypothetical protein [Tropicibacter oceani]WGW02772.1 hypothetical protein QF118_12590 [Tropicibacter oceani]
MGRIGSGQAQLVGAIIKEVSTGQILGHVQQTQGLAKKLLQAGGSAVQAGFAPLGLINVAQNEQIKARLGQLSQGLSHLQSLQFANMALTGIGIGVMVSGFVVMSRRLNAIEAHLDTLREDVREIGKMMQQAELRILFSDMRAALKDLEHVATRKDHLSLASALQRQFSTQVSRFSDLLEQAMRPAKATTLPKERLDLIWSLSSALWLCQEAELRALFVSEDMLHVQNYADLYVQENLKHLVDLNPDALARLIAASQEDLGSAIALRLTAASDLSLIADGFSTAIENLGQQRSLAQALVDAGISGRDFIQAATGETEKPLLFIPSNA